MSIHSLHSKCIVLLCIAAVCFFAGGCDRGGCSDPQALNYDSTANKDDGSCMYCDKMLESEHELEVIDSISTGSEFYGQVIAKIHLHHVRREAQFDVCGPVPCKIYYQIENKTNKGIQIFCSFRYYNVNYGVASFADDTIQPFETYRRDSIIPSSFSDELCAPIDAGSTGIMLYYVRYI